jgi:serine/threonine protein phosphatase 1
MYFIPDDIERVYGIGDPHGRGDLFDKMIDMITTDSKTSPGPWRCLGLGDYIDRGHESQRVLATAHSLSGGAEFVFLPGNHENRLVRLLNNEDVSDIEDKYLWGPNGGLATMANFGVRLPDRQNRQGELERVQRDMIAAIPTRYKTFMESMKSHLVWNGYLFSHAGFNPHKPLSEQNDHDFIYGNKLFPYLPHHCGGLVPVHGHFALNDGIPEIYKDGINVDTNAWLTGNLTAVVLERGKIPRLLQTAPR